MTMRTHLVALLLVAGAPVCAQGPTKGTPSQPKILKQTAKQPAPVKVTSVEGITEYRLANGLRVLLFPDPSKANVTVNITYLVGSRHENYGETGMAHLLEHMVFKGTPTHPDIPKILNSLGARFNGTTWLDRTNYFITFPATEDNLAKILDMEADRMVNSFVGVDTQKAAELLKTEMTVVRNEFEMGENDPLRITLQRTMATAFEWHNYGKSTIGCRADIENVSIERLSAFFKKYYQPDNATLLVAGKIDEAKTLQLIHRSFGKIPKPIRVLEPTYTLDPVQDGERSVTVRRVGDVHLAMAIYKTPAGTDADAAALDLFVQIMADAPSGRLYKALVDTKKATMVFPFAFATKEPGFVLFGAQALKTGDLEDLKQSLVATIEKVSEQPFTAEEIQRAKTALLKQVELTLNDTNRLGVGLSEYVAQGDWRLFFLQRDRIEAVKPEDVQRVAAKYFKLANRTLGSFIPTEKPDRAEIPAVVDAASLVKDYKGRAAVAQGEAFDTSSANIDARTQSFTLPAGLKVALLPKKTRGESVALDLTLRLGDEASLNGKSTVGELMATMLDRGSSRYTRQQIADTFDRLKAEVQIAGQADRLQIRVNTTRPNLKEVVDLLHHLLTEASFPQEELVKLVDEEMANLESMRQEPQYLAKEAMYRHVEPWPKGHPRYTPTLEEALQEIKAIKREDLVAFHKTFLGASAGELVLVGDLDAETLKSQISEKFGTWKSSMAFQRMPYRFFNATAKEVKVETPDKANAVFFAHQAFQIQDTDPDYPALLLGNYLLGGGALKSRLADRIRQKEGLSYGVGSQLEVKSQDPVGALIAFAIFSPKTKDKLLIAFREEVDKALKTGFSDEEVKAAKTSWLQGRHVAKTRDRELAARIGSNLTLGRTMAWHEALEKQVEALTPAQIQAALQKFLDPSKMSLFFAGDFEKSK